MIHSSSFTRLYFVLAILLAFGLHESARAQTQSESGNKAAAPAAAPTESAPMQIKPQINSADQPNQIELLRKQIEQLQGLLEQQQLSLAEMQKQLIELKARGSFVQASLSSTSDVINAKAERDAADRSPVSGQTTGEKQTGPQKVPVVAGWDGNHAFLRSTDGNFETLFTGYAQLDFRGYAAGIHPANTFVLRRARLALEGKLFRYFDYKVEGDFADTSSTLLRDAYVRVHRLDQFQMTFGQFKEPFSQEELRSDAVQDFVERSLVNHLAPSRSPGLMFSGVLHKGVFEYQLGAFNGKGLLAANTSGTPETVARLRISPWKNSDSFWLKGLVVGGASAYGRGTGGTSVRGQTESRSISLFTPDTINGSIVRANGELTWIVGPAALRAEYDQTNQDRRGLGPKGTTLPGIVAKGYTGQFTYLLTGEHKTDVGSVTPRRNLFGDEKSGAGSGAWELKFRYSNLRISDGTAKSNRAETFYFGPNWYLNKFVRYVLDFGVERYSDLLRTPKAGQGSFFVVLSRVQFAF